MPGGQNIRFVRVLCLTLLAGVCLTLLASLGCRRESQPTSSPASGSATASVEPSAAISQACPISIISPDGGKTDATRIAVTGRTEPLAHVSCSDLFARAGKDGAFSLTIPLRKGLNVIRLLAYKSGYAPGKAETHVIRLSSAVLKSEMKLPEATKRQIATEITDAYHRALAETDEVYPPSQMQPSPVPGAQFVPDETFYKAIEMQKRLFEKYLVEIQSKYDLTRGQIEAIYAEALEKNWPLADPLPLSLMP